MSETQKPKKSVHITLQEKGGVGKSVLSSILAQALIESGRRVRCLDCDPFNASLAKFKALDAKHIKIMTDERKFLPQSFDQMMLEVVDGEHDSYIIDNGSASFMQLSKYMFDDGILEKLVEEGLDVYLHSVVVAGGEQTLVLRNFDQICEGFGDIGAKIVVWENQFLGPIQQDGKTFEEFQVFKKHKSKIHALIKTEEMDELRKLAMEKMLNAKLTFNEVNGSELFNTFEKSRLHRMKNEYFERIQMAKLS